MTTTEPAELIDEHYARQIASLWHGGQTSALYAFTSTGTITAGLADEIGRELRDLGLAIAKGTRTGADAEHDALELADLARYVGAQPAAKLAAIANEYPTQPAWTAEEAGDPAGWVLVEESRYGGHWLSWHASPEDAATYARGQEHRDDWHAVGLVDIDRLAEQLADPDTLDRLPVDEDACDAIAALLDGVEWEPSHLDDIAAIIRGTGRTIRDTYNEGDTDQ